MKRFALFLSSALATSVASAQLISINFVGNAPAQMDSSETAGVVAASNWNNATGASGSIGTLVNNSGSDTSASVNWSTPNGTWSLPNAGEVTGNANMMEGYLDNFGDGDPTSVAVSGVPYDNYDVYVYFDGDNGGDWRVASFTIGDTTITGEDSENNNFLSEDVNGIFQHPVPGDGANQPFPTSPNNNEGNFVLFEGLTGDNFELLATPDSWGATPRASVNGIQIVSSAIPEPSTVAYGIIALAGALLHFARRRRQ